MRSISRRSFLTSATLAAAASAIPSGSIFAAESAPPIGVQLFSARQALAKDFPGTLKRIAALGYREVEAAGFYNHSAASVKQMMDDAGLHCVSAHYSLADLLKSTNATIEYAKALGLHYVICSAPWSADPAHLERYSGGAWQGILHAMTLDDWKWNAEQFNRMGQTMHRAGLKFGYHNHTMEFRNQHGSTGYNILLTETDPLYVTLELDCGWAIAAGQDPARMLRRLPGRFSMLHLKDLKPAPAGTDPSNRISTEIGYGVVHFRPIFESAKATGIRHYFVEQEDFDKPVFQALAIDYKSSNILARGGRLHPA
jgi:sugar phosphate isomerase/epimerase